MGGKPRKRIDPGIPFRVNSGKKHWDITVRRGGRDVKVTLRLEVRRRPARGGG